MAAAAVAAAHGTAAAEQRGAGGVDDEPMDYEGVIDGELQHEIRNGTLFGIGLLGGIGGLDGYGFAATAAAATASAGGEDREENGTRQKHGETESVQSSNGSNETVSDGGVDGDDGDNGDHEFDRGSGSDTITDANSDAKSRSSSGLGRKHDGQGPSEATTTSGREESYGMMAVYEAEDGEGEDELEDKEDDVSSELLFDPSLLSRFHPRSNRPRPLTLWVLLLPPHHR